jgi:hypothetical protein
MKKFILVMAFLAGTAAAHAGNDALSQPSPAPLGERVAIYLQMMMSIDSAIWEQSHPIGMDYREVVHMAVNYEPAEKLIGVSVVGTQDDLKYVQALLAKIQKALLSFNKKINNDYGVELSEQDFSLAYLNVKTGRIIMRLKGGQPVDLGPTPTPVPQPTHPDEVDMTPKL